jgi:hypothetical protein
MFSRRERIIEAAAPLLKKGEVVAQVVRATQGPNKWFGLLFAMAVGLGVGFVTPPAAVGLVLVVWMTYARVYARRIILVTDRRILVIAGSRYRYVPTAILDELEVDTRLGPTTGLWMEIELAGRRLFVVPRTARELMAADAVLDED